MNWKQVCTVDIIFRKNCFEFQFKNVATLSKENEGVLKNFGSNP